MGVQTAAAYSSFVREAEHQKAGVGLFLKQILKQMQLNETDHGIHEDQISMLSFRVTCASGYATAF
jgi:hypothetical protein